MSAIRLRQRGRGYRKNPQPTAAQLAQSKDFPAPMAGWITNENVAMANPLGAIILDNWFPTERSIQVRGGSQKWATLSTDSPIDPVRSLINYKSGSAEKLFAACNGKVFNITSIADEDLVPGSPDITGQTSDHYSAAMLANASGTFLTIVNGTNNPWVYNGTTWDQKDGTEITGGVTPSTLSQCFKHRSRMFFIQGGTMDAYYLAINSFQGAATLLPLGGIFKKGGSLLFGATWSVDAGDGADDRCIFVTTEGEVAVYTGGDPAAWSLIGRYDIGSLPRGKNAWLNVAGDVLLITEMGVIPISQVVTKDPAALSLVSVAKNISDQWHAAVRDRGDWPWEGVKYGPQDMGLITWPMTGEVDACVPVVNLKTGAWARFTAWDALSLAIHGEQLFFGTTEGMVYKADVGADDDGALYTAKCVLAFSDFDAPGSGKTLHKARPVYLSSYPFNPQISASVDYNITLPSAPSAIDVNVLTVGWDASTWDVSTWDDLSDTVAQGVLARWEPIGRNGFSHALQIQVSFSGDTKPNLELLRISTTYTAGATVVLSSV